MREQATRDQGLGDGVEKEMPLTTRQGAEGLQQEWREEEPWRGIEPQIQRFQVQVLLINIFYCDQITTVCVTGAGAGVDSVWEQEKLEARKILENAAESPASSARFVSPCIIEKYQTRLSLTKLIGLT
jgi:hypothetical protein